MLRAFKRFWLVPVMLALGSNSLFAFALLGPFNEAYQVGVIGFQLTGPNFGTDLGGPKNIGQGYRYNTPVIYYAADASFLTYFGTNGMNEIDKAFAIFNSLSNVDSYSPTLAEVPLKTSRLNFAAAQLGLIDLKSTVMHVIMEQLGVAEPDRYTFALHSRALPAGSLCPNFEYFVIMRNYDPVTFQYSPYVNGVLYTFGILELCNASAATQAANAPELADAVEVAVDPTQAANELSAVAAFNPLLGGFYTGLTRDDVGALRYLWSSNRVNTEAVSPDSAPVVTNFVTVTNPPSPQSPANSPGIVTTNLVETTNGAGTAVVQLREGMERINFVRVDFDSFIGQAWGPVTNSYTLTAISNSRPTVQKFIRVVTAPDITFSVSDQLGGPAALTESDYGRSAPNFNAANALPNLAGPGTITPGGVAVTFNNVGPVFEATTSGIVGQLTGSAWGSFDGRTNAPVLYPTTATLQSLLNSVFLQITLSGPLPVGKVNVPYSFQLQATGASPPPYSWALAPGTGGLPNGLGLSSSTGLISGTPTKAGIFDVAVSVADSAGRSSQRFISIEIDP